VRVLVRVAVVIPAKDEADRIAATVAAVCSVPHVERVVVVDDGSGDDTAGVARRAGADVVRHPRNRGKAAALETGVRRIRDLDGPDVALLFADGDLEHTAANLGVLVEPVLAGAAAMTIATLPAQLTAGGGRGLVVRLARDGIGSLTEFRPVQPLSGMRCLTAAAFDAASPLARGWGVETGLTVDVLRAGLAVREVPCDLRHRVSGADWRGQAHRAAQYRDVWLALVRRGWRPWRRS
jgi:glycosyltransferase involved in cell wall biosynthesis